MKPDICIYHGNCADGFGAAWAVWRRWGDAVQFVPGVYGKEPPDVTGKRVLMVDFSYKYDVLTAMSFKAQSLVILDHHKTAQTDLARLPQFDGTEIGLQSMFQMCWSQNMPEVGTQFDMERSGAQLAWDFCFAGSERPKLIDYIADRDLWRFDLHHSREVAAWLFSHPYEFDLWHGLSSMLAHDMPLVVAEGAAIERKHHKDIAELLPITTRDMMIGGVKVPCANLPYTMASDAAGKLAECAPFGACYFDRADARVFSLRSRGHAGADVSEIAKNYGGGGHRNAAGFQMPIGWEGDAVGDRVPASTPAEVA